MVQAYRYLPEKPSTSTETGKVDVGVLVDYYMGWGQKTAISCTTLVLVACIPACPPPTWTSASTSNCERTAGLALTRCPTTQPKAGRYDGRANQPSSSSPRPAPDARLHFC